METVSWWYHHAMDGDSLLIFVIGFILLSNILTVLQRSNCRIWIRMYRWNWRMGLLWQTCTLSLRVLIPIYIVNLVILFTELVIFSIVRCFVFVVCVRKRRILRSALRRPLNTSQLGAIGMLVLPEPLTAHAASNARRRLNIDLKLPALAFLLSSPKILETLLWDIFLGMNIQLSTRVLLCGIFTNKKVGQIMPLILCLYEQDLTTTVQWYRWRTTLAFFRLINNQNREHIFRFWLFLNSACQ